ncbi:unnamed protein product, partial [Aphanomyces euteiches]
KLYKPITIPVPYLAGGRDTKSIRRKFKSLRNSKKPTGGPECPSEVVQAKRINRLLEARMSFLDMGSDSGVDSDKAEEDSAQPAPVVAATPRTGLDPSELMALGNVGGPIISQTAQRRRRIDEILSESAENETLKRRIVAEQQETRQSLFQAMLLMEERQQARDHEYKQHLDRFAAAREEREEKRLERQEAVEAQREVRQLKADQIMMALLSKLLDK